MTFSPTEHAMLLPADKLWIVVMCCLACCATVRSEPTTAPAPKRITLHYDNASIQSVFGDLGRQLGVEVHYLNLPAEQDQPRITLHADNEPVALILQKLYTQAKLGPASRYDASLPDGALVLAPFSTRETSDGRRVVENPFSGPTAQVGPYLLIAQQFTTNREVRIDQGPPDRRSVVLQLRLLCDPTDPPLGVAWTVPTTRAVDQNGLPLLRDSYWSDGRVAPGQVPSTLSIPLFISGSTGQRVAELSGMVQVLQSREFDTITIPDILHAAGARRTLAGIPIVVSEVTDGGNHRFTVKLRFDMAAFPPTAANDLQGLLAYRRPQLLDADGRAYQAPTPTLTQGENKTLEVTIVYFFEQTPSTTPPGPPDRLDWRIPTLAEQVSLPFTFKDLPLP